MKKYFLISDIHSFASEMKCALKKAGFNKKNKDNILVVLGDVFDRGNKTIEVFKYLNSIPKKRLILIKGNHEDLYKDLLNKQYPDSYDFSNGTVRTFCHIAGFNEEILSAQYWLYMDKKDNGTYTGLYDNKPFEYWKQIAEAVKQHPITKWIYSDVWKDYYEINDKFICVHSFIPTKKVKPFINWRKEATSVDWESARWGCPWSQYKNGLFKEKNKTLICGHWHTSDFYEHLDENYLYSNDIGPIYYSKKLIGIDGGCMYHWSVKDGHWSKELYHPQNVLVIDEQNICYDKFKNVLKEGK